MDMKLAIRLGRLRVKEVQLKKLSDYKISMRGKSSITIKCDTICVSGGWTPTVTSIYTIKRKIKIQRS